MNYAFLSDINGASPIITLPADGSPEQEFTLTHVGKGKYTLGINHSDGGFVNCECANPASIYDGVQLTGRDAWNDDTQYFWLVEDPDHKGEYIIENGKNPSLVITSYGNKSTLTVSGYTKAAGQRWKIQKAVKVTVPEPSREKNLAEGKYRFVNASTGYCMNYSWGTSDPNPIAAFAPDNSPEQIFTLTHVGSGKYTLAINHSDGGFVNCECPTPNDITVGTKLTGRSAFKDRRPRRRQLLAPHRRPRQRLPQAPLRQPLIQR